MNYNGNILRRGISTLKIHTATEIQRINISKAIIIHYHGNIYVKEEEITVSLKCTKRNWT
jgi:molybdopterin synthase catalytic subunit